MRINPNGAIVTFAPGSAFSLLAAQNPSAIQLAVPVTLSMGERHCIFYKAPGPLEVKRGVDAHVGPGR